MRIDLNAKTPDLPESKSASRQAAGRVPAAETGSTDEATLAGHTRVRQLQLQTQQLPEDGQGRVEALARAIREGQYNVSPEQIAQSLLSEMVARSGWAR